MLSVWNSYHWQSIPPCMTDRFFFVIRVIEQWTWSIDRGQSLNSWLKKDVQLQTFMVSSETCMGKQHWMRATFEDGLIDLQQENFYRQQTTQWKASSYSHWWQPAASWWYNLCKSSSHSMWNCCNLEFCTWCCTEDYRGARLQENVCQVCVSSVNTCFERQKCGSVFSSTIHV